MKISLIPMLLLSIASVQMVQASDVKTYTVEAAFYEPMTQSDGGNTVFKGSFQWDTSTSSILNLTGWMNSSMVGTSPPGSWNPTINLTHQLGGTKTDGSSRLATVFLNNSTDVFQQGGYATSGGQSTNGSKNAFFTIAVNPLDPTNVSASNLSKIVYADCTSDGLMGKVCMTGEAVGGTMGATPLSLTIKAAPSLAPSPGINRNGSSVTISLVPNDKLGQDADWWFVAHAPWGKWYSYAYPNTWVDIGTDLGQEEPAYQGQLTNISSLPLFNITGLPGGNYELYFGVDMNRNGLLDYGQLYYSKYVLNIP